MVIVDEEMRSASIVAQRISDGKKDSVVTMYNGGHTISDIARSCGVSRTSVYRIVKERTVSSPGDHDVDGGGRNGG